MFAWAHAHPRQARLVKPVPATSDAVMEGHPRHRDHVQILVEAGYMQNCNISPANMMVDSPMTPDKFHPHLWRG